MRLPVILASLIPLLALQGCGDQNALASEALRERTRSSPTSNESLTRLYGHQNFTIVYSLLEKPSASKFEYIRDWGRRRAELLIGDDRIQFVYEDGRVWVSTSDVPGVYVTNDKFATSLLTHMDSRPDLSIGHRRMLLSGLSPTGQTGEFAGHACRYYRSPAEISTGTVEACATDWGALLYTKFEMPQAETMTVVASEVRIGDGGPDEAFAIDKANAQEADAL